MGTGLLFVDPGLWFVGGGAHVRYELFVGGGWLFMDGLSWAGCLWTGLWFVGAVVLCCVSCAHT